MYHMSKAGLSASVGCVSDWWPGGCGFDPPPGWQHSFMEIWSWNIFYGHSVLSADSRRAVISFWRRMCTILVKCLEDYVCPVNVWLGKLTALDMTRLGWLGRKASTQNHMSYAHSKDSYQPDSIVGQRTLSGLWWSAGWSEFLLGIRYTFLKWWLKLNG